MLVPSRILIPGGDIGLALCVLFQLSILILPIPTFLLDMALALSFIASILILLISLSLERPLDFSSLPTLLLLTTILRLSLNVATARLILSHGSEGPYVAGHVVAAFGGFLMGGDVVSAPSSSPCSLMVNFVVITKGSSRIAEVAARFYLDSMPGKQMAIDADLSVGTIDEADSHANAAPNCPRKAGSTARWTAPANSFAAMPSAALVITLINIFGGLAHGRCCGTHMSIDERAGDLHHFDGGRWPGFADPGAAGFHGGRHRRFPRAPSKDRCMASWPRNWGRTSIRWRSPRRPRAFWRCCRVCRPCRSWRSPHWPARRPGSASMLATPRWPRRCRSFSRPTRVSRAYRCWTSSVSSWDMACWNSPVEWGIRSPNRSSGCAARWRPIWGSCCRRSVFRTTWNLTWNHVFALKEISAGTGELRPLMMLAISPGDETLTLPGEKTVEPTFGLPACWIAPALADQARSANWTVVDPATVLTTHLAEVVKENIAEFLSYTETQKILAALPQEQQKLVADLVPSTITVAGLQRVLQMLLAERVSIRDMPTILEAVQEPAPAT